jgi:hypothetical protein
MSHSGIISVATVSSRIGRVRTTMNQFEMNQVKSRLRRLELSEEFVDQYVHKIQVNCESYAMACKTIDRWQKQDSREVVSQVLGVWTHCSCVGWIPGHPLIFSVYMKNFSTEIAKYLKKSFKMMCS